jgi:curli biogenesis system outer membrane secretion channel CsgG
MTDVSPATLEQRVRNTERELRRANERIAALVEQRQRVTGARFLVVGGITVLLMVVGLVGIRPGSCRNCFVGATLLLNG